MDSLLYFFYCTGSVLLLVLFLLFVYRLRSYINSLNFFGKFETVTYRKTNDNIEEFDQQKRDSQSVLVENELQPDWKEEKNRVSSE